LDKYKEIEVKQCPNDEEMQLDYKMFRSDFDKDIKEIFNYKPKNILDLKTIINKLINNTEFFKCLYNSNAEASLHMNIRDKYFNSNVMVNVRANALIKENIIQTLVSRETYEYYKVCIFDFIVYNYEGYPIKIIELQRGKHHNEEDEDSLDRIYVDNLLLTVM